MGSRTAGPRRPPRHRRPVPTVRDRFRPVGRNRAVVLLSASTSRRRPSTGPRTRPAGPGPPAAGTEVTHVRPRPVPRLRVPKLTPRRRVRLYSRPHIDLLRFAGALCRP
ncbi:putative leader peptide [Streptomyces sp. V3I8]|uniref:putative leader peptide n=1 Tax=Streptomyces sp. V3I8 TaxID=3042279 RepID=UPI00359361C3